MAAGKKKEKEKNKRTRQITGRKLERERKRVSEPPRPKSQSFAFLIASASSENLATHITGPKIWEEKGRDQRSSRDQEGKGREKEKPTHLLLPHFASHHSLSTQHRRLKEVPSSEIEPVQRAGSLHSLSTALNRQTIGERRGNDGFGFGELRTGDERAHHGERVES